MAVKQYQPIHILLPKELKKDFSLPEFASQKNNKENFENYDDYSLFYDVFFDYTREKIWAVGPDLYSSREKFSQNLIVRSQEKVLQSKYHQYTRPKIESGKSSPYSVGFLEIDSRQIDAKNPMIELEVLGWNKKIVPNQFPEPSKHPRLTLSVLQKNYSVEHILKWVRWHERLTPVDRILFYDNGSKNYEEIVAALSKNKFSIEIVIIPWPYYYGKARDFSDLFAQRAQMNHTLKIHHKKSYIIGCWDMDEYLIACKTQLSRKLKRLRDDYAHIKIPTFNTVSLSKKEPKSLLNCSIVYKEPKIPKFIYNSAAYFCFDSVHGPRYGPVSPYKKKELMVDHKYIRILHANIIRVRWKSLRIKFEYHPKFDKSILKRDWLVFFCYARAFWLTPLCYILLLVAVIGLIDISLGVFS